MEPFETYRSYLFAIAYRMLGSAMDAEDIGNSTWVPGYQSRSARRTLPNLPT